MVERLDEVYAAIREEVVMSTVNSEPENLAHEVAEVGTLRPEQSFAERPTDQELIEGFADRARRGALPRDMLEIDQPSSDAARASGFGGDDTNIGDLASALTHAQNALDAAVELCCETLVDEVLTVAADAMDVADDAASFTVEESNGVNAAIAATDALADAIHTMDAAHKESRGPQSGETQPVTEARADRASGMVPSPHS